MASTQVDDKRLPSAESTPVTSVRSWNGPLRALAGARRARNQGGHDSSTVAGDREDSSRSLRRFLLAAASPSSSRSRPTTRQVSRPGRTMGCRTSASRLPRPSSCRALQPAMELPSGPRAWEVASAAPGNFVRVDLARLDDLMRLAGDLVVTRSRLDDTLRRAERQMPSREFRLLQEHDLLMERQLRDLREGIMRVRLVPVGEVFRRMPFVVRDLARDIGKRVTARDHRSEHGDRQVPHRTDDGSDPPSGSQRRWPRDRDRGPPCCCREAARGNDTPQRIHGRGVGGHRDRRRRRGDRPRCGRAPFAERRARRGRHGGSATVARRDL